MSCCHWFDSRRIAAASPCCARAVGANAAIASAIIASRAAILLVIFTFLLLRWVGVNLLRSCGLWGDACRWRSWAIVEYAGDGLFGARAIHSDPGRRCVTYLCPCRVFLGLRR